MELDQGDDGANREYLEVSSILSDCICLSATGGRIRGLVISLCTSLATNSVLLAALGALGGPGDVPLVTTLTVSVSLIVGDVAFGIVDGRSTIDDCRRGGDGSLFLFSCACVRRRLSLLRRSSIADAQRRPEYAVVERSTAFFGRKRLLMYVLTVRSSREGCLEVYGSVVVRSVDVLPEYLGVRLAGSSLGVEELVVVLVGFGVGLVMDARPPYLEAIRSMALGASGGSRLVDLA